MKKRKKKVGKTDIGKDCLSCEAIWVADVETSLLIYISLVEKEAI